MGSACHQKRGSIFCSAAMLVLLLFVGAVPSWAGPVLLSGQTPDVSKNYTSDPYYGSIAQTYSLLFANLYHQVTNGQTKVLAIGNIADLFIYDLVHDVTPVTVDRVDGSAVATVDFSAYAVIYIPSSTAYNFYGYGGNLSSRAADIAAFVNAGGGLVSLARDPYDPDSYGFLSGLGGVVHYDNGTNYGGYSAITPTAAGVALGSAAGFDLNDLNSPGNVCGGFSCGSLWGYDVYTAYPSFLQSLATANAPSQNWYDGKDVILYGNTAAADLSVTKTGSPDPVTVGSSLTYTVTVTNNGPNNATAVSLADTLPVGVTYVSAAPSQGTCSQAGGVVSCGIGSLPAGAIATVTIVVTPTASGTITNTASAAGNEPDPNTANNTATATTVVSAPDLVETSVTNPPATAVPGSGFSATDTVLNQGTAASGSSTTRYYLSLDTLKSSTDKLLTGSRSVPGLAAGASSTGTVTVTVPSTTALGTYYLLACADDAKVVIESSETNNCTPSAATVQLTAPDLVETAVTNPPGTAVLGSGFSVTDTAANNGTASAGSSTTRYYLSLDTLKSGTDKLLTGSRSVPGLAALSTSTGTVTVTIPTTIALGTYYLLTCADDAKVVKESNEKNNCKASANTVVITP